jgi:hypothetical protein
MQEIDSTIPEQDNDADSPEYPPDVPFGKGSEGTIFDDSPCAGVDYWAGVEISDTNR